MSCKMPGTSTAVKFWTELTLSLLVTKQEALVDSVDQRSDRTFNLCSLISDLHCPHFAFYIRVKLLLHLAMEVYF